ncbi:MAG TPA: type II toxin-antitoxin system VapC family toxin [Candidatus Competibacter sp.]|nr:type II toxin-antitoxin system VapC family toxin [Candidatus Competibacteraceae bacterium]HRW65202.1 type II toxin-antitoxin system VapC family toxin [Candidatus Competibacter sp.]
MNVLLDTHVALWAITDSPQLSPKAREILLGARSHLWVSAASLWEIAIKHSLGRGAMPVSGEEALGYFRQAGYGILPIEPEHAVAVEQLASHHQDPFDRLLVAQALTEPMRLLTHDERVASYNDAIILV